jgi:hypothetical protein
MTQLIVISLLAGMVLGQRFKVLVLAPAIAFAVLAAIGAGVARPDAIWAIVLAAVATTASLQIGYLAGIGIRHLRIAARASRPHIPVSDALPARRPPHY